MKFKTPKTNWVAADYFNVADWERIKGNLDFLHSWLVENNWTSIPLESMEISRGIASLPTVELINRLETNLRNIHDFTGLPVTGWRDSKTWYARLDEMYISNPSYHDWNRWEEFAVGLKESIAYLEVYLHKRICGTFYAGSNIRVQLFSRGR